MPVLTADDPKDTKRFAFGRPGTGFETTTFAGAPSTMFTGGIPWRRRSHSTRLRPKKATVTANEPPGLRGRFHLSNTESKPPCAACLLHGVDKALTVEPHFGWHAGCPC